MRADSDFQQQRLKAWQPLLTPKWVIGTFLLIGLIFIPIGVVILVYSDRVVELEQRYDNYRLSNGDYFPSTCKSEYFSDPVKCNRSVPVSPADPNGCRLLLDSNPNIVDDCSIQLNVTIDKKMEAPVYFYYKLSNFYQNHRRYVKSRSDTQLRGDGSPDTSTCDPLSSNNGSALYPCGLIAGSFFNDVFSATLIRSGGVQAPYVLGKGNSTDTGNPQWQKDGIAWTTDKKEKFKYNPAFDTPAYSRKSLLGTKLPRVDDEDFIVWMRTAGLPTFKKLYRKISNTTLNAGDIVTVSVFNYYPVSEFNGQKAFVFSTTSWLGGKNSFLGWAYIVVGIICVVLAIAFLIKHLVSPRPLGDMKYFNWPGQQQQRTQ